MRALGRQYRDVLFFVDTSEPLVAVTIDDGPDGDVTDKLLDALGELGVKATFFLLASEVLLPRNRNVVRRIVAEGHELGNHLMNDVRSASLSRREFESQLCRSHSILSEYAEPRFFRPGAGWFSGWMLETLRKHGYTCALGSIYPYDAHHTFIAYSKALITLRVHPGGVIVLHDRGRRGSRTIQVLADTLPRLIERGYGFRTLSELQALAP